MCRKVTCTKCSRPTWAGCGMHIEAALAGVPVEDRCKCRETAAKPADGSASGSAAPANGSGCSIE